MDAPPPPRPLTIEDLPASTHLPPEINPLAEGVFMAHQRRWLEDSSKLKIASKGRRTGITFAQAWEDTLTAASARSAGGMNCFYIPDVKEKGLEYIGYVRHFAECIGEQLSEFEEFLFEDEQENGTTKYITAYRAKFASGFRVQALASRPANIRGLQGQVTIDEAAFHGNVREVINSVNALLIWGGRIRVISTHNGVSNPFNVLILEAKAGKSPFKVHEITFQDAVDAGLYERVCLVTGEEVTPEGKRAWYDLILSSYGTDDEARDEELFCVPRASTGTYLPLPLIQLRQVEGYELIAWRAPKGMVDWDEERRHQVALEWLEATVQPFLVALPRDRKHALGGDFGRFTDRSDFAICSIDAYLRRRFPLIVELADTPFDVQALILYYILDRLPMFQHAILDANGIGMALSEAARQRYGRDRITELKPSESFYLATMPLFKSAMETDGIWIPMHSDVRDDLGMIKLVNGVPRVPTGHRRTGTDGKLRHGDSGMALVYGFAASQVETGEYGYQPAIEPAQANRPTPHEDEKGPLFGPGAF